jgi:hypothetical protein
MTTNTHSLPSWRVAALLACTLMPAVSSTWAKLPPPSDEAKAKAAEAAAKAAWQGKVDGFQLCKSMDSAAAAYFAQAKKSGKEVKPAVATPALCRPGPVRLHASAPGCRTRCSPSTRCGTGSCRRTQEVGFLARRA